MFGRTLATLLIGIAIGFFVGRLVPQGGSEPVPGAEEPAAPPAASTPATPEADPVVDGEPDKPSEEDLNAPVVAGHHMFISIPGTELSEESAALIAEIQPGGVILMGDNIVDREQTSALVESIKEAAGNGSGISDLPLIAVDQEGGTVNRLGLEDAPSFTAIGATLDRSVAYEIGKRYGSSLSARGIGVLLAPVLDVRVENTPETIAARTLSDDNAIVTPLGLAFADGAMEGGVISVVKHFPGHGAADVDSHDGLATIDQTIRELALTMFPFNEAVDREIPGVMVGHMAVPAVDVDKPDLPASLSRRMLANVLRTRWEYEGVIIADDINMTAVTASRSPEEAAVAALVAGNDTVIYLDRDPERIRAVAAAIDTAANEGTWDPAERIASAKRIEEWQSWLDAPAGLRGPLPNIPDHILADRTPVPLEPVEQVEAPVETAEPSRPTGEPTRHQIARGDTLIKIARQYGVSVDDIMKWNNLEDGNIKFGFFLDIFPEGDAAEPPTPEPAEDPIETEEETTPAPAAEGPPTPAAQPPGAKKIVHEVTAGEMLSRIAVRYKVRQSDIMAWTGFTDPIIKIGQKLTIYVPEEFELEPETEPAPQPAPVPEAPAEPDPTANDPAAEEIVPVEPSEDDAEEADAPTDDEPEQTPADEASPPAESESPEQ